MARPNHLKALALAAACAFALCAALAGCGDASSSTPTKSAGSNAAQTASASAATSAAASSSAPASSASTTAQPNANTPAGWTLHKVDGAPIAFYGPADFTVTMKGGPGGSMSNSQEYQLIYYSVNTNPYLTGISIAHNLDNCNSISAFEAQALYKPGMNNDGSGNTYTKTTIPGADQAVIYNMYVANNSIPTSTLLFEVEDNLYSATPNIEDLKGFQASGNTPVGEIALQAMAVQVTQ